MKTTFTALFALLFCVALTSCKSTKKDYAELEKAGWLIGKWGNTSPNGTLTETWEKTNDSIYSGHTSFVIGKDTVFTENIQLEQANGKLAYITVVSDQNGGKPVRFEMTSMTENQIIFENPAHNFPQKITYNKTNNDSLVASISGKKKGKFKYETFPMTRQR